MVRNMRIAVFVLSIAIAGCGSAGGGTPASQGDRCSTGTEVVLVSPIPGTTVSHHLSALKIASSAGIAYKNTALLAKSTAGATSGPFPLVGPVPPTRRRSDPSDSLGWATPTPTPSPPPTPTPKPTAPVPFPSPVYYAARGFKLAPSQTYLVQVVRTGAPCQPYTILNAQFKTARK
jgi:hypothetical protein